MAPQPPTSGTFLPRSFTCRVCGKDRKPEAFSKTQIQKWFSKKRNDLYNTITPQNVGLTCKDHILDEREIRCHGPCDLIKIVDRFSKNQRNKPEPWCIECTEWRLGFNGDELPTAPPNDRLACFEYDGVDDDDDDDDDDDVDDGFRLAPPKPSFDDNDEDENESSEDDDENSGPYGDPTIITSAVDRLQGYGSANIDEGTTTDAASTTDTMGISGWGGQNINAGRGLGGSARTVTSMQAGTLQSRGTSVFSNSMRNASNFQGHTSAGSGTITPAGVASHLNQLALGPAVNHQPQIARTHTHAQAGQKGNSDESVSTLSSRISAGRPLPSQMSEGDARGSVFASANKPPTGWEPNVKNRESRKENSNKWYKGDNRKVFPGKKRDVGHTVQDGRQEAHDSDSPDEM
ncbi:hypothetical protein F5Y09DRAFT_319228 [Xylaria sp. FL1042]|nr:hypothetical protein F5Y09DRAFT_319228 [Xylaria sp. FL1042]